MQAAPFVPQHTQSISFCQNIIVRCSVEKMTMPSCPPKRPRLHLSAYADVILRGRYLTKKVAVTIVETPPKAEVAAGFLPAYQLRCLTDYRTGERIQQVFSHS